MHSLRIFSRIKKQLTLSNFVNSPRSRKFSGKETDDITRAIVDMVVFDYMPLQMVEGKGFKKLMSIVAPNYNIPSMYLFIFIYTFTEYPGTRSEKRPSNRLLKIFTFQFLVIPLKITLKQGKYMIETVPSSLHRY